MKDTQLGWPFQMGRFPQLGQFSKLAVNHTSFPRMADFSHNWAKKYMLFAPISQVRRQSQCRDVTFAGPKKTTRLLRATTSLPNAGAGIESGPKQMHARTCANYDLKDTMSPNFERSDTVHWLYVIFFWGNFHTTHHSKWNNNRKKNLHDGAYDSHPICLTIRHKCKLRLVRFVCEYWSKCHRSHKDTYMSEWSRRYLLVRRKFCFLWRGGRNFGPGYGMMSDYKMYI